MVRCTVDLGAAGRLAPMPFIDSDGRAVAWLEIGPSGHAAVFGTPAELRELATAATTTAELADQLLAVAGQLADTTRENGGR